VECFIMRMFGIRRLTFLKFRTRKSQTLCHIPWEILADTPRQHQIAQSPRDCPPVAAQLDYLVPAYSSLGWMCLKLANYRVKRHLERVSLFLLSFHNGIKIGFYRVRSFPSDQKTRFPTILTFPNDQKTSFPTLLSLPNDPKTDFSPSRKNPNSVLSDFPKMPVAK
jgi:hypothetical protein